VSSTEARKDVADDESGGYGCCFYILAFFSFLLIIFLFPFSLICSVKVSAQCVLRVVLLCWELRGGGGMQLTSVPLWQIVKEYERAVILRLGRLVSNKAKGPGMLSFFNHHLAMPLLTPFSSSFPPSPSPRLCQKPDTCVGEGRSKWYANDAVP